MASSLLHIAPLREGLLKKTASSKGEDVFRGSWQDRYFRLFPDRLDYYKAKGDNTPQGSVDLRAALVEAVEPRETQGTPFCIRIAEAKQVWLYLAAASAVERDDWLRGLRTAAGVEEDLQDTLAAVAAVHLKEHALNMAAWTVLLQPQLPETPAEVAAAASGAEFVPPPPELATIVLGAEGMFRIYKDAKLWRTYDGTQLVAIESTEKAEHGMGIGKRWRMLAEVRTEFKLHPATSGTAAQMAGGFARYHFYTGTEEECSNLLPHLKSIRRNDLGALMRMGKKAPVHKSVIEVFDASFRTQWTSKYALCTHDRLIIFRNLNDPSPWRVFLFHSELEANAEGKLGLNLSLIIEREAVTIKFSSEAARDEWLATVRAGVEAAKQRKAEMLKAEAMRAAVLESLKPRQPTFRPLSSVDSPGNSLVFANLPPPPSASSVFAGMPGMQPAGAGAAAPAAASSSSSGGGSGGGLSSGGRARLSAADLSFDDGPPPPPPPASTLDLFSFEHPELEELKPGEPAYALAIGSGSHGQLGQRNKDDALKPVLLESLKTKALRAVAAGVTHAGVLTETGQVWMFGSGVGVLGLGDRMQESKSPYLLTSLLQVAIRTLVCGARHTIAVGVAGQTYSWGENGVGQCGMGHRNPVHYPTLIPAFANGSAGLVVSVSAGFEHSAAIVQSAEAPQLFVWGSGAHGCLGLGNTDSHAVPQQNALASKLSPTAHVAQVSCGTDFTLLTLSDGSLFSVGNNHEGQLGQGDRNRRSLFTEIKLFATKGVKVFKACAGASHSVVLGLMPPAPPAPAAAAASSAAPAAAAASPVGVFTFGAGILNGFREFQSTPIQVGSLQGIRGLSVSASHTLALSSSHRAFAFGINKSGELGNGVAGVQALVKVRLNPSIQVVSLAAGHSFSLLLCRGTPPDHLLPGTAPEAAPPPPATSQSTEIKAKLGLPLDASDEGLTPDLSAAMDSITKLLQMEALISDEAQGTKTTVERGDIDLLQMLSVAAAPAPAPAAKPSLPTPPGQAAAAPALPTPPGQAKPALPMPPGQAAAAPALPRPPLPMPPGQAIVPAALPALPATPFVYGAKPAAAAAPALPTPPGQAAAAAAPPPAAVKPAAAAPVAAAAPAPAPAPIAAPPAPSAAVAPLPAPAPAAAVTDSADASASAAAASKSKKEKTPLPPGWVKVKDPSSGRSYYYETATKVTSWKRPKPVEAEEEDIPPPPPPPED